MIFARLTVPNLFLILCLVLSPVKAVADQPQEPVDARLRQMQTQIAELQSQLAEVRARESAPWLDERRAEEVRELIRDVLADADTRASLLNDEVQSGYNGGFFIRSADDQFLLKIGAYAQFRYLFNTAADDADDEEGGFQTRRLALIFSGYIGSPKVSYIIMPAVNRADGSMRAELMFIKYAIDDAWSVTGGQFKAPFYREWLTSAKLQPMLERSYVNSLFSSLYVQGVELTRQGEDTRLTLAVHNGEYGWNRDFNNDNTDYAVGARGEWKLAGNWKQFADQVGWADDEFGVLLGSAIEFDRGETGGMTNTPDILKYTADISVEDSGWNLLATFTARQIESNGSAGILEADQWAALIQGGVFIIPDKMDIYARYSWIDVDGVAFTQSSGATAATRNDVAQLLTVGSNIFLRGHATKFTFDVIHAFDGLPKTDTGTGLRASNGPSTTARAQVMISF